MPALIGLLALTLGLAAWQPAPEAPPRLPLDTYPADARAVIEPAYKVATAQPRDAASAGRLAMALHAWEQWDAAHAAYERARRLAPTASEWPYLDAVVLTRLGRHADAASRFDEALRIDPALLAARVKLAEALLEVGRTADAAAHYAALASDPRTEALARFGLGRIAAQTGRHADAVPDLERAVALFPEFGPAHYALALSYRALGRRDEARRALARHQELGPRWPAIDDPLLARVTALKDDAGAQVRRGLRLAETGDLAGAIAAHEAALVRNPQVAQAHANLITLYGRVRNWAKAEEHYRATVALGFNLDDAHYNHGVLLVEQRRWTEAEAAFRLAIEANPLHAEARNNLGQILEGQRRFEEAASEYRRAIESRPTLRIARFNLGRMLIALNRPADAITELEPLLAVRDADTPRHLFALSAAMVRANRRDAGLKLAEEARQLAAELGQSELAAAIGREVAALKLQP